MNKPDSLYYITHIDNVPSILEKGILSHNHVQGMKYQEIRDFKLLRRRKKIMPNGKTMRDCVNLYFQPRNAMLYRLTRTMDKKELAVLQVKPELIKEPGTVFSDRNATNAQAQFFAGVGNLKKIDGKLFKKEYWTDSDDSKQRRMAEVLVPRPIRNDEIMSIYVASEVDDSLKKMAGNISIAPRPDFFFAPRWQKQLTDTIALAQGDMFFSAMQTLTVSVNLQGIMGRGVAARAKYQFPDAYVRYQDDCKSKKLKIGKPTLFKRGISIEEELAVNRPQLKQKHLSAPRWFLFLPTKRSWRERSYLKDIEKSMQWLVHHYKKENLQSIALPALGCGLGHLSWRDVGPMMCGYLAHMDIQCCIYLPTELSKEELLSSGWLEEKYLLKNKTLI